MKQTLSIQMLYEKSRYLLHFGEDGSPLYADELSALNQEVESLGASFFTYETTSQKEESFLCVALLISFAATYCHSMEKEKRLNTILDRVYSLLFNEDLRWSEVCPDGLLRCQLAIYACTFTADEDLLGESERLISKWKGRILSSEEEELLDLYMSYKETASLG